MERPENLSTEETNPFFNTIINNIETDINNALDKEKTKSGMKIHQKRMKLDPESEHFDSCYYSDSDSDDGDLNTVTQNFEEEQKTELVVNNVSCTINYDEMNLLNKNVTDRTLYLEKSQLELNNLLSESKNENKTLIKRQTRENKYKNCVGQEIVDEVEKTNLESGRGLTAYGLYEKAISDNLCDLKTKLRELRHDEFQQFSGVQKTTDEVLEKNCRNERRRSYVPCFGETRANYVEQTVYLEKLRSALAIMKRNDEIPQVVRDVNSADYDIKITVSDPVEIPPWSQQMVQVEPMIADEFSNDVYLFQAARLPRYTLQDGTMYHKKGQGTIANHSDRTLYLKKGHLIGLAKRAEFVNLPSLDDIFDTSELILNAVETSENLEPNEASDTRLMGIEKVREEVVSVSKTLPKLETILEEVPLEADVKKKSSSHVNPYDLTFDENEPARVYNEEVKEDGPVAQKCLAGLKKKLEHCSKNYREMVWKYRKVFITEEVGQPMRFIKYKPVDLPLRDNLPDFLPLPYKRGFSRDEQVAVDQWLRTSVASGLIDKVDHARVLSPVLIVRKTDENGKQKTRFLLDARQLNAKVLSPVSIPFPDIGDGLKNLSKMKFHTSMDVKSAFHRVPISQRSKTFTAFVVSSGGMVGTYTFNSLIQGGLSSPAIFCSIMQQLLRSLHGDVQTYCFVDDNLTSSETEEQHVVDVEKVLSILDRNWVVLDYLKSEFCTTTVMWCGFKIGDGKYAPDPERLDKLDDLLKSVPSCRYDQLKRWQMTFGLCNYYRRFIPNYSRIETNIRNRIEEVKNRKIGYKEADFMNFNDFKFIVEKIKEASLVITDRKTPIRIRTDASITALGFVVETMDRAPIMYGGRKLSKAESHLSMFELELRGVLYAIEKSQDLILNAPSVVVESDNLAGLRNLTGKCSHVVSCGALRTILAIQTRCASGKVRYAHISGCLNFVSDYLSRCEEKIGNLSSVDPEKMSKLIINSAELGGTEVNAVKVRGKRVTRGKALELEKIEKIRRLHACTHDGVNKMLDTCRDRGLVVPNLKSVIQGILFECRGCNRERKVLFDSILALTPTPSYPFESISVDHTFFRRSRLGSDCCLTIVDDFSKYFQAISTDSANIDTFLTTLQFIKQRHPLLRIVKADNAFNYTPLKNWCLANGIELRLNCSHNSRANTVERYNGTLKDKIAKFVRENNSEPDMWEDFVERAVVSMNATVHSVTKMAPFELISGGEKAPVFRDFADDAEFESKSYREKVEAVRQRLQENYPDFAHTCEVIKARIERQKLKYSHTPKDLPSLRKGDKVFIKYSHRDPMIPAIVVQDDGMSAVLEKTGPNQTNQHKVIRCHKRHIWRANKNILNAIVLESVYNVFDINWGTEKMMDPVVSPRILEDKNNYELWRGSEFEMEWESEN